MSLAFALGWLLVLSTLALGIVVAPSAPAVSATSPEPADPLSVDSPGPHAGSVGVDPSAADPESAPCPAKATPRADDLTAPRIVAAAPNPTVDQNVGEYVVIEVPDGMGPTNLTVTDGHGEATAAIDGTDDRVALSRDPNTTAQLTEYPVVELDGHVRFAADGDVLALESEELIDAIAYEQAPEGEIWYRSDRVTERTVAGESTDAARGEWWPRDGTCLGHTEATVDEATAFVLPDSPERPLDLIADANQHIRLGGYTFTDEAVTAELEYALDRGVEVEILLDAGPVGGVPAETEPLLDQLETAGASVRVLGGDGARFRFHHAKYAVVDDRVLVTTENWKPSGVGGASSRGWGTVVDDEGLADELAAVFEADATGHDTDDWISYREEATFVDEEPAVGTFPTHHEPTAVDVDRAELLLAPDNAESRLVELLSGADESILIKQVNLGSPDFVLLEETLDAARDGVEVSILLDDSWYVAEENRRLADELEEIADREGLSLEVSLVDGDDRFEKIHAKGVVVDEETVVVGSINWNEVSLRENREVALVLHGKEVGNYYATVFEADREGGIEWPLPLELALAILLALALAGAAGHRLLHFGPVPAPQSAKEHPKPVTIEPVTTKPVTSEPETSDPVTREPVTREQATSEPPVATTDGLPDGSGTPTGQSTTGPDGRPGESTRSVPSITPARSESVGSDEIAASPVGSHLKRQPGQPAAFEDASPTTLDQHVELEQPTPTTAWNGTVPSTVDWRIVALVIGLAALAASLNLSYGGVAIALVAFGALAGGGVFAHLLGVRRLRRITDGLVDRWTADGLRVEDVTGSTGLTGTAWTVHTEAGPITVTGLALAPLSKLSIEWQGTGDIVTATEATERLDELADEWRHEMAVSS